MDGMLLKPWSADLEDPISLGNSLTSQPAGMMISSNSLMLKNINSVESGGHTS
jgi:hypothetical protein